MPRHLRNDTAGLGDPVENGVMKGHEDTVTGGVNISLEVGAPEIHRMSKSCQGVLDPLVGSHSGSAPMGKNGERTLAIRIVSGSHSHPFYP